MWRKTEDGDEIFRVVSTFVSMVELSATFISSLSRSWNATQNTCVIREEIGEREFYSCFRGQWHQRLCIGGGGRRGTKLVGGGVRHRRPSMDRQGRSACLRPWLRIAPPCRLPRRLAPLRYSQSFPPPYFFERGGMDANVECVCLVKI